MRRSSEWNNYLKTHLAAEFFLGKVAEETSQARMFFNLGSASNIKMLSCASEKFMCLCQQKIASFLKYFFHPCLI